VPPPRVRECEPQSRDDDPSGPASFVQRLHAVHDRFLRFAFAHLSATSARIRRARALGASSVRLYLRYVDITPFGGMDRPDRLTTRSLWFCLRTAGR
jgi:hypothetical protein